MALRRALAAFGLWCGLATLSLDDWARAAPATADDRSERPYPTEFKKFASIFYKELFYDVVTEDELIEEVLDFIRDPGERLRLKTYLETITDDAVSDQQLQDLWKTTSAQIVFEHDALRIMLKLIRDHL